MGGRQLWAALCLAPGEADGAGRCNRTNKGGSGETHSRRSPRPGPASSGVAAHASRRGPAAAETNTNTKEGPLPCGADPARTPTG